MAAVVRRAGRAASRGLRSLASPSGIRGAGTEVAWIAAHVALYPLGFRSGPATGVDRRQPDGPPPAQRGPLAAEVGGTDTAGATGTPILLVHGMVGNGSIFTVLRRALRRHGFGPVHTVNYSPFTSDVRTAARTLGRQVETLCAQTGYERVHVIAHSLGGVIARYYAQRLGGDARVHTLVTLGAPHQGTYAAHLLPVRLARQLRPGSDVLTELAAPVYLCRTRFVALWSDLDQLIYPKEHARLEHPDLPARNVLLPGVGHMSLPIDRRVVREVVQTLAHLHADGSADAAADTGAAEDTAPDPAGRPARATRPGTNGAEPTTDSDEPATPVGRRWRRSRPTARDAG
jgi:pimeloyl-ACP methyl ester carboxylesterase